MKIGILGTRGVPNAYGGFEAFAERLAVALILKGHETFVYSSSEHPYQQDRWQKVNIIHGKDFEKTLGPAGQFIYDLNCINDARRRNFDVLLHLGYTSDSVWHRRWPRSTSNIVNMDGLEWKRSKYSKLAQWFLKKAEAWAAKHADHLIADSIEIKKHLLKEYNKEATYIPYGADVFNQPDRSVLDQFDLQPQQYYLTVSRLEPENNIEMIIRGYLLARQEYPLLIVGSISNKFGRGLKKKYANQKIKFVGGIYDKAVLNNVRYFSKIHFHGHSSGGTNPSLLEAMACSCEIVAHDNVFNREVLQEEADYFSSANGIAEIINQPRNPQERGERKRINLEKIRSVYNWNKVIDSYEQLMLKFSVQD